MARPLEKGIRYFSVDTNMLTDRKIQRVLHPFGAQSIAIILKLWSLGYEENGYYLTLDKNLAFDIAFAFRLEEKYVNDVITACIEAEIFDKTMWDKYEILTSRRMQENFLNATKKRKNVVIDKKYYLLTEEETELSEEETEFPQEESTTNDKKEGETQQIILNQTISNNIDNDITVDEEESAREDEHKSFDIYEFWLISTFGKEKYDSEAKKTLIELVEEYGEDKVRDALERTIGNNGATIAYTATILANNAKHAARVG